MASPEADDVDRIIAQWAVERPDVDVSAMAIIGRLSRLERRIRPRLDAVFAAHGLEAWEFDVLATLRRSGAPFRLTAGELLRRMMVTSGTMTNRIDRLEQRRLVRRRRDSGDGRVVLVELTASGRRRVDAALVDHAANEREIVRSLGARQQSELIGLLRTLLVALESDG